jgi:hypothetical protein
VNGVRISNSLPNKKTARARAALVMKHRRMFSMQTNYNINHKKNIEDVLVTTFNIILAWTPPIEFETTSSIEPLTEGMDEVGKETQEAQNEHAASS